MSKKPERIRRRLRVVEAEPCPRCGAKVGEKCSTYKGRKGPPHALAVGSETDAGEENKERLGPLRQNLLWGEDL